MFYSPAPARGADNLQAARTIFGIAALLESQGANPYRVRAYRRAAVNLLRLPDQAQRYTTQQGELGVPWLGPRLRRKVGELVTHGHMQFQDELLATLPRPLRELIQLPGVGPKTAERLIRDLRLTDVPSVAAAARAGKLRQLRGIGEARERQILEGAEAALTAQTPQPRAA